MKTILAIIGLVCALFCISGCGNQNMTTVKAQPKPATERIVSSEARWKTSYNRGLALYQKGQHNQALELFAVSLKYTDDYDSETRGWLYYSMGRCWEGLGELAKAEQNYIMAQNLDPHLSEASEGLSRITKLRAEKE